MPTLSSHNYKITQNEISHSWFTSDDESPKPSIWVKALGEYTISADLEWNTFLSLVKSWHRERGQTSSVIEMSMRPSYQRIIGMGEKALPFIFKRLEDEGDDPDHWFWALKVITQNDPVPPQDKGHMKKMSEAWLAWGRKKYAW